MAATHESKFIIAIYRADGSPVYLKPGGAAERNLRILISTKLAEKGVGIFRTQAQVLAAWEAAYTEALFELKSDIVPVY